MTERPIAEYAVRNAAPILDVLKREFRDCSTVLEIGSGTGQHAVTFAASLEHLHWQTSDLEENHAGITAWLDHAQLANVSPPLSLDVRATSVGSAVYDAVYSSNTAHIMGIDAVERMFLLVGQALRPAGLFCLYGPFRFGDTFNTQSNERFDADLRRRDPSMGLRDIETLDRFAEAAELFRRRLYAVPSNNNVVVWQKGKAT